MEKMERLGEPRGDAAEEERARRGEDRKEREVFWLCS